MFNFTPMNAERKNQEEIEAMIDEALRAEPDFSISSSFTDKLVIKVQRHLEWKELITEFAMKIGLVAGALIVLAICLIFPSLKEGNPVILFLMNNLHIIFIISVLILFTFFIDQVLLKYFFRKQALPEKP